MAPVLTEEKQNEKAVAIPLPRHSIAKAGRDIFSIRKDLTVVMVPFERHSIFPRAIEELYHRVGVPFNLIVVEAGAPDSVRELLEKKQQQHSNLTVLYAPGPLSAGAAFNLALPHIKTPYAFFMDNETRVPDEALVSLMKDARDKNADVIFPQSSLVERKLYSLTGKEETEEFVAAPGIRFCAMVRTESLSRIGRFDESMVSFHAGLDWMLQCRKSGVVVASSPAGMECRPDGRLEAIDEPLYNRIWSRKRIAESEKHFEAKWKRHPGEDGYRHWIARKMALTQEGNELIQRIRRMRRAGTSLPLHLKKRVVGALRNTI